MPTTASRTTSLWALMIAAVTVTGVVGCSGGSDTADPAPPGSSDDSSSADDAETAEPGCLIGDWVASGAGLENWYRSFLPDEGIILNSALGELLLSFSDADFIYTTREITLSLSIAEQDAVTRITGGVAGTYDASSDGIMSSSVDSSDLTGSATVSGITLTTEDLGIDLTDAGSFVGYQCTGGKLILETQSAGTGTAILELEPAG